MLLVDKDHRMLHSWQQVTRNKITVIMCETIFARTVEIYVNHYGLCHACFRVLRQPESRSVRRLLLIGRGQPSALCCRDLFLSAHPYIWPAVYFVSYISINVLFIYNFRSHRCTTYVDAAYCYRHSSVVSRSVCVSVSLSHQWTLQKRLQRSRYCFDWGLGWTSEPCIAWGLDFLIG